MWREIDVVRRCENWGYWLCGGKSTMSKGKLGSSENYVGHRIGKRNA